MNEKQKMLNGFLYDADSDPELKKERDYAKDLCFEFNRTKPSDEVKKAEIIKKLFGKIEGRFLIQPDFWCDYGYNIEIGDNFFANHGLVILDCAKVKFGKNVLIAPNCGFYTAGHPLDVEDRNKWLEYAYPITVGDNVWFGGNVVVCPGVKIGSNSVIAAGSVVVKDIPDNVLAGGVPCKVIRKVTLEDKLKYKKFTE